MKKAYSYLRVSSPGQVQGDGFARQREVIAQYAAINGHFVEGIVAEFLEKGVTGTADSFDRPALSAMIEAIKTSADGCTLVLVERADRLARDLMISEILLAEFRKLGVQVIAAECGTDLTVDNNDPTKKLIRQILGAVSEWEKSCLVHKLRVARQRSGCKEGRKPYGSRPGENDTIILLRHWQSNNVPLAVMAQRLNEQGTKARGGGKWHATAVQRILARQIEHPASAAVQSTTKG